MTKKARRLFTAEQKAEAVAIVHSSEKRISQIARELGISATALRKWVKQAQIDEQGSPQGELSSSERQELIALRRELKRVQMERDFLKKAATFFARENSAPMS